MKFRIRKRIAIISAIGLLGLAGTTAAFAHHRGGHFAFAERIIASRLDLDDQQREKLAEVKRVILEAKENHRAKREAHAQEMEALILSDQIDEQKVQELVAAHQRDFDEALPPVLNAISDFHESLSDEQKQKAVETMRKFRERHHH